MTELEQLRQHVDTLQQQAVERAQILTARTAALEEATRRANEAETELRRLRADLSSGGGNDAA